MIHELDYDKIEKMFEDGNSNFHNVSKMNYQCYCYDYVSCITIKTLIEEGYIVYHDSITKSLVITKTWM